MVTDIDKEFYAGQPMFFFFEQIIKHFADFLSSARGSEPFEGNRKTAADGRAWLLGRAVGLRGAGYSDCTDVLRRIWYRVRTELCDVVEVALCDKYRPLSGESVDRLLQSLDFKDLSGRVNIVVYEAPQMHAEADGAAAVHEAALHHKVIDEKTWNEKWV